MKAKIVAIFILLLVGNIPLVALYTTKWYNFTTEIQAKTSEEFQNFQTIDADWKTLEFSPDQPMSVEEVNLLQKDIILAVGWDLGFIVLRHRAYVTERFAYQDALLDMSEALVKDPNDYLALREHRDELVRTQQEFYDVVNEFANGSTLKAMWHTK